MKQPQVITRHSVPNQYDQAPYGALCEVIEANNRDLYIQHSKDEDNPRWVHIKHETVLDEQIRTE